MFGLGMQELVIIGVIAVLLFGKRLPEVARSLGGTYRQFKSSLGEFQNSVDFSSDISNAGGSSGSKSYASHYDDIDDHDEATAPRFEPPPSEPKAD